MQKRTERSRSVDAGSTKSLSLEEIGFFKDNSNAVDGTPPVPLVSPRAALEKHVKGRSTDDLKPETPRKP